MPSFYREKVTSISDEKDLGKVLTVHVDIHKFPEQKSKHQKVDKVEQISNTDGSENAIVTGRGKPDGDPTSKVCESPKPVAENVNRAHCSSSGHHTPYQNASDSDSNDDVTNMSEVNNGRICLSNSFDFVEDQLVRKGKAVEDTAVSEDGILETGLVNNVTQTNSTLKICVCQENFAGTCTKCPLDATKISVSEIEEIATGTEKQKHKRWFEHKQSQIDLDVARTSPEVTVFSAEHNCKRSPQALQNVQLASESSSLGNYQSCDSSQGSFKSRSDYISFSSSETVRLTIDKLDESTNIGSEGGRKHFSCANKNGSHDFQQTNSGSANVEPQQNVFPFSSSLIDLVCSINRLVAFTCHLCKILCSNGKTQRSDTGYVTCANDIDHERIEQSDQVKKELCYKLVQVNWLLGIAMWNCIDLFFLINCYELVSVIM